MTNNEVNSEIADYLSDAIRATDEAYDLAVEYWGKDDPRSQAIELDFEETDNGKCPYCGKVLIKDGTTIYCEEGCF